MTASHSVDEVQGIRKSLRLSVVDGVLHAVMLGACESYLGALAVELGHDDANLALLATLPLVIGALSQLVAAPLTRLAGSHRRFVVAGALLQAASVAGLVLIATLEVPSLAPLLLVKIAFWSSGSIITPAWGAWMARLTHDVDRERYFARRSGFVQAALTIAFVGSGATLHLGHAALTRSFAIVFSVAVLARLGSALALALKTEPADETAHAGSHDLGRLRQALREGEWRIPAYLAVLMFGAQIAIPFFTPYMLRRPDEGLGFEYATFTGLMALSILGKALMFPQCHRLAGRFGLRPVLLAGGIGVAAIPFVWYASPSPAAIAGVQLSGGMAWAALEYASFQLLLRGSPDACRTEFLALAGALAGFFQLAGALVGSWLRQSQALPYTDVFLVSGILRSFALAVLLAGVWRLRTLPVRLFTSLMFVRPVAGGIRRPLGVGNADDGKP